MVTMTDHKGNSEVSFKQARLTYLKGLKAAKDESVKVVKNKKQPQVIIIEMLKEKMHRQLRNLHV